MKKILHLFAVLGLSVAGVAATATLPASDAQAQSGATDRAMIGIATAVTGARIAATGGVTAGIGEMIVATGAANVAVGRMIAAGAVTAGRPGVRRGSPANMIGRAVRRAMSIPAHRAIIPTIPVGARAIVPAPMSSGTGAPSAANGVTKERGWDLTRARFVSAEGDERGTAV